VLYYNVNFAFLLVDHAAARYKSLREKYRREKLVVSREYKSGTSPSQREQWPLFNVLSFLDKQIRPRKSSCSIKSTDPPHPLPQTCEELRDSNLEDVENTSDIVEIEEFADNFLEAAPETSETNNLLVEDIQIPSTSGGNLSGQTRKRGHSNSEVNTILQRLAVVAEKSIIKPTGAYYHFGQYVGEVLAKLSEQEADLAVEDIMSVLLNAKRKCRGQLC
jgi:hypothetical protein